MPRRLYKYVCFIEMLYFLKHLRALHYAQIFPAKIPAERTFSLSLDKHCQSHTTNRVQFRLQDDIFDFCLHHLRGVE